MDASVLQMTRDKLGIQDDHGERHFFVPLRSDQVGFLVTFSDGAAERYEIVYTAGVEAKTSDGHWRYRGHCLRQMALINRAGERFEKAGLDRAFELSRPDGGHDIEEWARWRSSTYRGDSPTCTSVFQEVAGLLMRHFHALVFADARSMENYCRHAYQDVSSVAQVE